MKNIFKASAGFILLFLVHLPKLIYKLLLLSYSSIFNNTKNLTANPKEHLKRAKELLNKNQNSLLLYAALEIRFALERMVHNQLIFADQVSKRMLDEYDPSKKRKNMTRIDKNSNFPHKIILIDRVTGERYEWGEYWPIDQEKVNKIKGRLGDLLHPKDGLKLGISNDPWYKETRAFLEESYEYLFKLTQQNKYYFAYKGLDNFKLIKM